MLCTNCNSDKVMKYGVRVNKQGNNSQRYFCNSCNKEFSVRDARGWDKDIKRAIRLNKRTINEKPKRSKK